MSTAYDPKQYEIVCNDESGTVYNVWANSESEVACPTNAAHSITIRGENTDSVVFSDKLNVDFNNKLDIYVAKEYEDSTLFKRLINFKMPFYILELSPENPLIINETSTLTSGTGTITEEFSSTRLNLTVPTTSDRVVMQSMNYYPSSISFVRRTIVNFKATSVDNVEYMIGMYDDHDDKTVDTKGNGMMFRCNNGSYSFVHRTSFYGTNQTDTNIPQSSWNLDKVDGTSDKHNYVLDITKTTTLIVDQVCMSNGVCVFGFFSYAGIIWVHRVFHNDDQSNILERYNAPFRVEAINANTTSKSLYIYSANVTTDRDAFNNIHTSRKLFIGTKTLSKNGTPTMFSVRAQSTYNRNHIRFRSIFITSDLDLEVYVYKIATISGTFTTSGVIEYNDSNTSTGGTLIYSRYLKANGEYELELTDLEKRDKPVLFNSQVDGTQNVYSVRVDVIGNQNAIASYGIIYEFI